MSKKNIKRLATLLVALIMAASLNTAKVYALDSTWQHGDCYGEVICGDDYAIGSTASYEDHMTVSVSIYVRYILDDVVYYTTVGNSDYLYVEAEYSDSSVETIGVRGTHRTDFYDGYCVGYTETGIWKDSN